MKRIVVFSTTDIQQIDYRKPGVPQSTGELERAIAMGFTVYVVSTRNKLGDGDKWWFDQAFRVLLATTPIDDTCVMTPGLLVPWLKLYEELGIPLPIKRRDADDQEWLEDQLEGPLPQRYGFNSWLEARDYLMYVKHPNDTIIVTGSDFRRLYP